MRNLPELISVWQEKTGKPLRCGGTYESLGCLFGLYPGGCRFWIKRLDVTSVISSAVPKIVLQKVAWLLILKSSRSWLVCKSGAGKQQRFLAFWLNSGRLPRFTWWTVRTNFRLFQRPTTLPGVSDVLSSAGYVVAQMWSNEKTSCEAAHEKRTTRCA